MSVDRSMETTDADMGYMKIYIRHMHEFLTKGQLLSDESVAKVKEAHEIMQSVYCEVSQRNSEIAPQ